MSLEGCTRSYGFGYQCDPDGDDSEYMWLISGNAPIHHALKDFEQSYLRCPICHEFYINAVYIKACHHTFCSECVRKAFKAGLVSMRRKQDCPTCKIEVKDDDLVPDFGLQRCVNQFQVLRQPLKSALGFSCNNVDQSAQSSNVKDHKISCNTGKKRYRTDENQESFGAVETQSKEYKMITMPQQTCPPQRKPSPLYHGMKKKQLEALCRDSGLSCKGSEKDLIERHQNFITLWNAECDSETPRTEAEIVKELNRRENSKVHEVVRRNYLSSKVQSGHLDNMKQELKRRADGDSLDGQLPSTGDIELDQSIKDRFKKMIEEVRKRKEEAPKQLETTQQEEATTKRVSTHDKIIPYGNIIDMSKSDDASDGNEDQPPAIKEARRDEEAIESSPMDNKKLPWATNNETIHLMEELATQKDHSKSDHLLEDGTERKDVSADPPKSNSIMNGLWSTQNPYKKQETPIPISTPKDSTNPSPPLSYSNPYSKRRSSDGQSIIGEWSCSRCTFINKSRTWRGAKCEMCSFSRLS